MFLSWTCGCWRTHTSCCEDWVCDILLAGQPLSSPAAPHMAKHTLHPLLSFSLLFNKLLKGVVQSSCQNTLCLKCLHKHYATMSVSHQWLYSTVFSCLSGPVCPILCLYRPLQFPCSLTGPHDTPWQFDSDRCSLRVLCLCDQTWSELGMSWADVQGSHLISES